MEGKFSFIQKQLEASEKLYEIMKNDLRDRTQHQLKYFELMTETTHSLIVKLDGRDKEIKELKNRIEELEKERNKTLLYDKS